MAESRCLDFKAKVWRL